MVVQTSGQIDFLAIPYSRTALYLSMQKLANLAPTAKFITDSKKSIARAIFDIRIKSLCKIIIINDVEYAALPQ